MKIILKSFPGHRGRPGRVGGSLPRSEFGMRTGEHTPIGQQAIIDYLLKETGMQFKPYGSVGKGKTSKNDIDITYVEPSEEEQERQYLEGMNREADLRNEYHAGKITWEQLMEQLTAEENPLEKAMSKVGYEYVNTASWLGIAVHRFTNKATKHSIEVWMPGNAGYWT